MSEESTSEESTSNGWNVKSSAEGQGAINHVRLCEEKYFADALARRNPDLELIKLSIGDPTVFGNLPPAPNIAAAVKKVIDEGKHSGYGHSRGLPKARAALAKKYSVVNGAPLTEEDVVVTSSGSGALDIAISVFVNPGQNLLIPKPGFAIYRCLAGAKSVESRFYSLLPERRWEIDFEDMERLIDDKTAAIVINNPSNPCGSVFSREHLQEIASFAKKHRLPVIADETYAEMVFKGQEFHSLACVSHEIPILVCSSMSKRYLVPGWRVGWILIHDPIGAFDQEIRPGLSNIAMKLLGPCTLVQAALPSIIEDTPQSFFDDTMAVFEENARLVYDGLKDVPGLRPIMPSGTMYMMVGIDADHFPNFKDTINFNRQLLIEQAVFCLPGEAFFYPGYFRVVLVMPCEKIAEACHRIAKFCSDHYQ